MFHATPYSWGFVCKSSYLGILLSFLEEFLRSVFIAHSTTKKCCQHQYDHAPTNHYWLSHMLTCRWSRLGFLRIILVVQKPSSFVNSQLLWCLWGGDRGRSWSLPSDIEQPVSLTQAGSNPDEIWGLRVKPNAKKRLRGKPSPENRKPRNNIVSLRTKPKRSLRPPGWPGAKFHRFPGLWDRLSSIQPSNRFFQTSK